MVWRTKKLFHCLRRFATWGEVSAGVVFISLAVSHIWCFFRERFCNAGSNWVLKKNLHIDADGASSSTLFGDIRQARANRCCLEAEVSVFGPGATCVRNGFHGKLFPAWLGCQPEIPAPILAKIQPKSLSDNEQFVSDMRNMASGFTTTDSHRKGWSFRTS